MNVQTISFDAKRVMGVEPKNAAGSARLVVECEMTEQHGQELVEELAYRFGKEAVHEWLTRYEP